MTKDLDWTAAKAENARLRERERALIDELAEANAAHDDAETRVDAALLDLRIANEALATFNARVLGLEAELAEARRADWATGICSKHQRPDPLCRICNPALANARASAFEEAALSLEGDAHLTTQIADYCSAKLRRWRDGALQPSGTPPSGRFVANEVLERVEKALEASAEVIVNAATLHRPGDREVADECESALAALNAEKQR